MGLDDIVSNNDEKEDGDNPESLEDFDGDIDEYIQRLKSLSRLMANIDGRIEELQDDVNQITRRVRRIEAESGGFDPDTLASAFTERELQQALDKHKDDDDSGGSLWDSTS